MENEKHIDLIAADVRKLLQESIEIKSILRDHLHILNIGKDDRDRLIQTANRIQSVVGNIERKITIKRRNDKKSKPDANQGT